MLYWKINNLTRRGRFFTAILFTLTSLLLVGCAPAPGEQWNSFYYGGTPGYEGGVGYYSGTDSDDSYSLPGGGYDDAHMHRYMVGP